MKHKYLAITCFSAIAFLAFSCSTEFIDTTDNTDNSGVTESGGYYITLSAEVLESGSRAHWDVEDDEINSLKYAWDASENEMKSFVVRDGKAMRFTDDKIYSQTRITPDNTIKTKALLEIMNGLNEAYQDEDVIWAVSPVSDTNIKVAESTASVEFTLPDAYLQSDATTEHLKPYVFMTGSGVVSNNSASLGFKVLPAIYRFKITNNDTETLNVSEVGITGPFCNKAVVGVNGIPQYSVSSGTYTIKVTTGDSGVNIEAGKTEYLYALVFPTATSGITENISLYIHGRYGNASADYSVTAPCNSVYKFDLKSNKYYDMQVPVARQGIEMGVVDVEEFQPGGEFDITIDK